MHHCILSPCAPSKASFLFLQSLRTPSADILLHTMYITTQCDVGNYNPHGPKWKNKWFWQIHVLVYVCASMLKKQSNIKMKGDLVKQWRDKEVSREGRKKDVYTFTLMYSMNTCTNILKVAANSCSVCILTAYQVEAAVHGRPLHPAV